ncbi:MAG: hypothetical protein M3203_10600 [Actinomycetota bacterium]|nr:hypothetical protein [Actinomycetota bacterium]
MFVPPADLKRAHAQVLMARAEGLTALERARGETAALRTWPTPPACAPTSPPCSSSACSSSWRPAPGTRRDRHAAPRGGVATRYAGFSATRSL